MWTRSKLLSLYNRLLNKYGPQHWWPAETSFEVAVGAILTQNTAWRNVERAIERLKAADALDPYRILALPRAELEVLIRPAGFYRQKAERLKAMTSAFLSADPSWPRMKLREHFLSVHGIGKETADSICLYAFDKPLFVIDAYTRRFCEAHGLPQFKKYDDQREWFERLLGLDSALFKEFHALIVAWGKNQKRRANLA